jgi:tripartite-type tricarboxylate transporter receptor subunit TctC
MHMMLIIEGKAMRKYACFGLLAVLSLAAGAPAAAQDFYAGKQITMLVGSAVGGGYDLYGRLIARYWPKYIAGHPSIVVQNVPAAGSLVAMNTLANVSPRDGTHIAAVQNHIGIEPIMGITGRAENAKYDGRALNWIGSAAKEVPVTVAWHTSGFRTFADMQKREMLVGSPGVATSSAVYANVLNQLADTKFKVIAGYVDNNVLNLAMENNEIQGRTGWYISSLLSTKKQWLDEGKILVLVQIAVEKHPAFPNVPLVTDFVTDPVKREQLAFSVSWLPMGRPFVLPADVPAERVRILRESFAKTLADPALTEEATKMGLEISPMTGEEVQDLIAKLYATPKETVDKVRTLILGK